ncbi:Neurexin-4 [Lamellibrachia satsuma]|nr:Neurexin-4 [Lamellibrachia satsuma]
MHILCALLLGAALCHAVTDVIDIMEPCRFPVPMGVEQEYIPDKSLWATTVINYKRAAKYGRLNGWKGGGAWTAGSPDTFQYLGLDLGYRHVITAVTTQGRRGSYEYVTEYYMEFSSDNKTWSVYTNKYGTPLMFEGNTDDNHPKKNKLAYPMVARFVRFNPQRWHDFISLRVELEGCRFDTAGVTFDGHSRITYDVSGTGQYVQSYEDRLKLRFRTTQADGLVFYADGNQGDYVVLELVNGKLYFHIDLGSTASIGGHTTMSAGSLLDNNQWHEVEIIRSGLNINFTVDQRTITNMTNGDFLSLDLDRHIHLGGLDTFLKPGKRLYSTRNFKGCMENVWFNYMDFISDARIGLERFKLHGSIGLGTCDMEPVSPITFPTFDSHLKLDRSSGDKLQIKFSFRSYSDGGLLFSNALDMDGKILMKINDNGYIEYSVKTHDNPEVSSIMKNRDPMAEKDTFTDGLWHTVDVQINSGTSDKAGLVNFTVDGVSDAAHRQLSFTTLSVIFVGGGDDAVGIPGFLGCMQNLEVNEEAVVGLTIAENKGVLNGTCVIQDRCDPNPCEHGGICSQNHETFVCNCDKTGYEGAVCHKSKYLVSCEEARTLNPLLQYKDMMIDIDDSGPLAPFKVRCTFNHDARTAITEIRHDSMKPTHVDGYQTAGSYMRTINYDADIEQFDELIARAAFCEQSIRYKCFGSKLLSDPGPDPNIPSWGWWVGRNNMKMDYWGGSSPGSGRCSCALKDECKKNNPRCNCDAGLLEDDVFDSGLLRHKEDLPVMELRFGDTGTLKDSRWGQHTLGPLLCYGDSLFDNIVTFRKRDATIPLPTFDSATSGDIRFQFRTTTLHGIFLQNTGKNDFIEVKLVFGNSIHFRFDVGNGVQTLEKTTAYPLNDGDWHTVHIERNRKLAQLKVDLQAAVTIDEPSNQGFRTLDLNSPLMIGASVDYSDGFVGCIRALMVNGVVQDLRGKVDSGEVTYGVSSGCHPKCDSNPCMNEGICIEWFSHYTCDCAYTPFRGWDCGREVGVNLKPNHMVQFAFDQQSGNIATDEEQIIIGFSTQKKQGTLMYITNDAKKKQDYISVEINNNGWQAFPCLC